MNKITFLAAFLCSLTSNAQTDDYDLNVDGAVDMADVSFLVKHLNGNTDTNVYDMNYDGKETLQDLTVLIDYILGRHQYVDLGLPSGTKWATCNVGADNPEDYGLYFAWGETKGYKANVYYGRLFDWSGYKWMTSGKSSWEYCTKYTYEDGYTLGCWYSSDGEYIGSTVDGVTYKNTDTLLSEDDAATAHWGSLWCMPTDADWTELRTNCTWELATINGSTGYKVTSDINGNSIFLPLSGYLSSHYTYGLGTMGNYWSSSLCQTSTCRAVDMYMYSTGVFGGSYSYRYYGESVRPVRK